MDNINRFKQARILYNQNGKQSVKTVAQNTGVTASLISDIEATASKPRNVSYLTVATLSKYYGVSIDWLVGHTDIYEINCISVSSFIGLSDKAIKNLRKMDDKTLSALNSFLSSLDL